MAFSRIARVGRVAGARVQQFRALQKLQMPVMAHTRSLKTLSFADSQEQVIERSDYPTSKSQAIFKDDTLCMLGYGTQGRGQALNLRDNGMPVILACRKGPSWDLAVKDGWVPDKDLFTLEQGLERGSVYMYLLSDAGQKIFWPTLKPYLKEGKTLYVSHGFSVVFKDRTNIDIPKGVDVILCAPKGSGTTVRNLFLEGRGINGSIAVHQNASGNAEERVRALGVAVGCGYLYETTFEKETYSDLVGERGVLMGMIQGAFQAQYEVLRSKGHSPSEAFNETVEEATQSLYPLVGQNGMDWMYANCSTTAQRGALDWYPKFHKALKPVFEELYAEVENGNECQRSLDVNGQTDYKEKLEQELKVLNDSEMWRAGVTVRSLRPENQ